METAAPPPTTPDRVPLRDARVGLALAWLVGSGTLFLLLIVQSFTDYYEGYQPEIWNWALPNILPALSLVLSVLGYEALREQPVPYTVDRLFFRIAQVLSVTYLLLVFLTVLTHPFTAARLGDATDIGGIMKPFQLSNLWLAPIQALVVSTLGVLFFQSRPAAGSAGHVPQAGSS